MVGSGRENFKSVPSAHNRVRVGLNGKGLCGRGNDLAFVCLFVCKLVCFKREGKRESAHVMQSVSVILVASTFPACPEESLNKLYDKNNKEGHCKKVLLKAMKTV